MQHSSTRNDTDPLILGIETSCDETGIALYRHNPTDQGRLIGNILHSQVALHADYGGVVPELASRDHIRKLVPLCRELLAQSGHTVKDLDAVAYTAGPGLMGALMVGASFGRTLAWSLGIPAIAVHHMEAHLLAPMLEPEPPEFPFVALLVSGGHTQLMRVDGIGHYQLLGESLDDAAGEAFDKVAKMLNLDYPGGPAIEKLALAGDNDRFKFPRPMTDRPGLEFSFSGLKTFAMNTIAKLKQATPDQAGLSLQDKADVAIAFQTAVVDTLTIKCRRALVETGMSRLVIAGGVSANQHLRQTLESKLAQNDHARVYYPSLKLCTDNGGMIAYAGCQRYLMGEAAELSIDTRARWPMTELNIHPN